MFSRMGVKSDPGPLLRAMTLSLSVCLSVFLSHTRTHTLSFMNYERKKKKPHRISAVSVNPYPIEFKQMFPSVKWHSM